MNRFNVAAAAAADAFPLPTGSLFADMCNSSTWICGCRKKLSSLRRRRRRRRLSLSFQVFSLFLSGQSELCLSFSSPSSFFLLCVMCVCVSVFPEVGGCMYVCMFVHVTCPFFFLLLWREQNVFFGANSANFFGSLLLHGTKMSVLLQSPLHTHKHTNRQTFRM